MRNIDFVILNKNKSFTQNYKHDNKYVYKKTAKYVNDLEVFAVNSFLGTSSTEYWIQPFEYEQMCVFRPKPSVASRSCHGVVTQHCEL